MNAALDRHRNIAQKAQLRAEIIRYRRRAAPCRTPQRGEDFSFKAAVLCAGDSLGHDTRVIFELPINFKSGGTVPKLPNRRRLWYGSGTQHLKTQPMSVQSMASSTRSTTWKEALFLSAGVPLILLTAMELGCRLFSLEKRF